MPLTPGVVEYRKRGSGRFRYRKPPHKQQVEGNLLPFYLLAPSLPLPLPLTILVLCDQRSGDRVLSDSLPSVFMRQFFGTNLCAPCLSIYLPGFIPRGSRKRQVMSPTMAPVPERPFTFSSLLRSQLLLLLLALGLLTGTDNVPTLLSLAHFTNRLSRAEPLFTTALDTQFTTTYCRVNLQQHALMHPSL